MATNPRSPQDELPLALGAKPGPRRLSHAERLAALRLVNSENVGPVTFRQLLARYGSPTAALEALPELARKASRGRPIRICPRDLAEAELEAADRIGAEPMFAIEPGYPPALGHDAVSPPLLYVEGQKGLLERPAAAIVGSRNASAAGVKLTRMLATGVGQAGIVVVSGLARGIDGAAHQAALETGTIAVVAGGLDVIYPPEHARLQRDIASRGCLVSMMPPGFEPRAKDFPRRNRIIAGLALAVVIVEAARRSGSLSTARMAAEQGREVLAVPGHPLDPRAEGTNDLIKRGAGLVTNAEDVLGVLQPMVTTPRLPAMQEPEPERVADMPETVGFTPPSDGRTVENRVLGALGPAPTTLDDLARATALPMNAVRAAIFDLALGGQVEHHGAQLVSLKLQDG